MNTMNETATRLTLALAIGFLAVGPALAGSLEPPPGPVSETRPADTCFDNTGNRFVDCGDGTIKDTETGYHWLKDANCFSRTWADGNVDAADLAHGQCGLTDGSLPGDWRLPTLECPSGNSCAPGTATGEFASIFAPSCPTPFIPDTEGSGCWSEGDPFSGVQTSFYWSGSPQASAPNNAWRLRFANGDVLREPKTRNSIIWPVRLGQVAGEDNGAQGGSLDPPPGPVTATNPPDTCFDNTGNRFVDCGDGTIKDTETGLYWLKISACLDLGFYGDWAYANTAVANLAHGQCGLTDGSLPGDWRLPTLGCPSGMSCSNASATGELGVLLNLGVANGCWPAIPDTTGDECWTEGDPFSALTNGNYWSASTDAANPDRAWLSDLTNFDTLDGTFAAPKVIECIIWPVRGGP